MAKKKDDKEKTTRLTEQQKRLCWNVVVLSMTQTEAYKDAYPNYGTDKNAQVNASKTLAKPHVRAYCEELKAMMLQTSMLNAQLVTAELMRLAFDESVSVANRIKCLDRLAKIVGMYHDETKEVNLKLIQVGLTDENGKDLPKLEDNDNGRIMGGNFVEIEDDDDDYDQ